jgi:hypothetical protein
MAFIISSTAENSRSFTFVSTYRMAKSRTDSGLANNVGSQLAEASDCQIHRSPCDHCVTSNCPCVRKITSTIPPENSLLFVKNIGENALDEIFLSESCTSWQRV